MFCGKRLVFSVMVHLHEYTLHFQSPDVRADLTLRGSVPPWRPGTGFSFFSAEKYFAWLPSVPQGKVDGTLEVQGRTITVSRINLRTTPLTFKSQVVAVVNSVLNAYYTLVGSTEDVRARLGADGAHSARHVLLHRPRVGTRQRDREQEAERIGPDGGEVGERGERRYPSGGVRPLVEALLDLLRHRIDRQCQRPSRAQRHELGIERAFRIGSKSELDQSIGDAGVKQARLGVGDAMHEAARSLLRLWFAWMRSAAQAEDWDAQAQILSRQLDRRSRPIDAAILFSNHRRHRGSVPDGLSRGCIA